MASKVTYLPFFCVLFLLFSLSNAKFDIDDTFKGLQGCHKGNKVQGLHWLKLYLARFGYLNYQHTPNHVNEENDEFDEELESALKSYQNFYHLNASGTLDEHTISQMIKPRCGQPDKMNSHVHGRKLLNIVSRYQLYPGRPKWLKSQLTYAFGSSYPVPYIPPVVRAFNTWASKSGYFTFSRVGDVTNADLKISFERGDHGEGKEDAFNGSILAHATRPRGGIFHYNADLKWSVGPQPVPNANDLETVALHEIGHLLGLYHSKNESAVMYALINTGSVKGLTDDDILGIKDLYGVI